METLRKAIEVAEELETLLLHLDLEAPQSRLQARNIVKALRRVLRLCEFNEIPCKVTGVKHYKQFCETVGEKGDVFTKCPKCKTMAPALDVGIM